MSEKRDYYETMGVSKNATEDEIKKAYRKLAKENHPDLNPGNKESEQRFKEINEAYEILSNKEKRQAYDQFGHAGVDPNYGAGAGGGSPFSGFNVDLEDIFGSIFGGGFGQSRRNANPSAPRRGSDIEARLTIDFLEAAHGTEKEISYQTIDECTTCHGTGCKEGTSKSTCSACNGQGQVAVSQRTPFGVMQQVKTCSKCQGKGKIVDNPCKTCNGSGNKKVSKKVSVNIPHGIADGQVLRLSGKGNIGANNGPHGDLLIEISVKAHDFFERRGNDCWCEFPITFTEAALGATITVPTIDGDVSLDIHEGTQPGEVFRLKGRGIEALNGKSKGDAYIKIALEVPKSLNSKQKELLQEFENLTGEKNYQKKSSFLDKIFKSKKN